MFQTLEIPNWHPTRTNVLMTGHWTKGYRLKKADAETVALEAYNQRIVVATTKRRVTFLHRGWKRGGSMVDADAFLKSLLDALKTAGLIVDDSTKWCEWETPVIERGEKMTRITLEDVES